MESCSVSTVSVWDEKVLGLHSGDSCITQWMYSMLLNYILKMVKMVHYMLSIFNHNKNIFLKGISVIFWIQKKISWVSHKWNTRTDTPLGSECAPRRWIPNVLHSECPLHSHWGGGNTAVFTFPTPSPILKYNLFANESQG